MRYHAIFFQGPGTMHLPLLTLDGTRYVLAFLVVLFAFMVRAIVGFGSGLISVALLVLLLPVRTAVSVVYLLDFAGAIALGAYDLRHVQWRELRWIVPSSLIGVGIGAYILKVADTQSIVSILGGFILLYVAYALLVRPDRLPAIRSLWAIPLGLAGGVLSSLYGGGGPPIVAYFQMRRLEKRDFRATFQILALIDAVVRGLFYVALGIMTASVGWTALWLLPPMALGLLVGNWLHFRVSERLFFFLALGVLLLSGLKLMIPH